MKKRELCVLDEDDYAMGLANVIERDFFPELQDLRDKKEYMEAERLDQQEKMREVQFRKRQRAENEEASRNEQQVPGMKSVDAYLGTYTSEDNASFRVLQEEELARRRESDAWGKRQAQLQELEASKKALLLEDRKDREKVLAIEYGNQQLMGKIPTEKFNEIYEKQLVVAAETCNERVIDPTNTRFTAEDIKRLSAVPKKVDVTGKRKKLSELVQRNRFLKDGNEQRVQHVDLDDFFPVDEEEQVESEPTVGGFGFISTPVIVPGVGVDESPLVSWGTVDVVSIEKGGRHFQIPEAPERDRVAKKLTESVSYSAEKMKQRGATPIVSSGTLKSPMFSPAGQKLLEERKKSLAMSSPFFKSPIGSSTPSSLARKSSLLTPKVTPRPKEERKK